MDSIMKDLLKQGEGNQQPKKKIEDKNKIAAKDFAAKYSNKYEVYQFLTLKVQAFLPACKTISSYFMKDIVAGRKKCKLTV